MTTAFEKVVDYNWLDYIISPGTAHNCYACVGDADIHPDDDEALQVYDEGGFSWSACDSCDSLLGGQRYNAHAIHREAFGPNPSRPNDIQHIEICADCLCYHANGDVPETWES